MHDGQKNLISTVVVVVLPLVRGGSARYAMLSRAMPTSAHTTSTCSVTRISLRGGVGCGWATIIGWGSVGSTYII